MVSLFQGSCAIGMACKQVKALKLICVTCNNNIMAGKTTARYYNEGELPPAFMAPEMIKDGADETCETCGTRSLLYPKTNKQADEPQTVRGKVVGRLLENKAPERQHESDIPNLIDNWRDPLTSRIQVANPADEEELMEEVTYHNVAMV